MLTMTSNTAAETKNDSDCEINYTSIIMLRY